MKPYARWCDDDASVDKYSTDIEAVQKKDNARAIKPRSIIVSEILQPVVVEVVAETEKRTRSE